MPRRVRTTPAVAAAACALLAVLTAVALLAVFRPGAAPSSAGKAAPSPGATAAGRPVYYLALGDSLSQGVQPATSPLPAGVSAGQSVETDDGYADDLYAHYAPAAGGHLKLVKLGCPGETTTSMLTGSGSPCTYPQGSQLAAAVAFIRAHPGQTGLITIDIGANNVDDCVVNGAISQACVSAGLAAVRRDLPAILGDLRRAAGDRTVIAGMNLYDPVLAGYLAGSAGQAVAAASVTVAGQLNQAIAGADKAFGVRTADVQQAFSTADFTGAVPLPRFGTVPLNVARICQWTWMCAASPAGPNIHANAAGYQVIAAAFERVIGPFPG